MFFLRYFPTYVLVFLFFFPVSCVPGISAYAEESLSPGADAPGGSGVRSGLEVLESGGFSPLSGKRVGLITNHTGRDSSGRDIISLLREAPGVTLAAVFSPEHGLSGTRDEKIRSAPRSPLGIPVYSLYGDVLKPTPEMLEGLDVLVFDIQDAGVRFYTYISTMAYAMEAAAAKGIPFYVLDRPNPITSSVVQGPVMDPELKSFTGYFPMPLRYGMTIGELALMFNSENHIGADLRVIRMEAYRRDLWYDETGLDWVPPSPNLRSVVEAELYPAVAVVEGANVSVGRGTPTPFEIFGAPWIDSKKLLRYLRRRNIEGVRFETADFVPRSDRYAGKICRGVKLVPVKREALDTAVLGVEIASALYKLFPSEFRLNDILGMIGSRSVIRAIRAGGSPLAIQSEWEGPLAKFLEMRAKYLLY